MTSEKHSWTPNDRLLLCLILKQMGFAYKTCENQQQISELRKEHLAIMQKAAEALTLIYGKEFSASQIEFQIYKTHMHRQLKEGVHIQPAAYQMMRYMIQTGLLDEEGFYNMHYGHYSILEKQREEDMIIKQALEIQKRRELGG